jgi:hypothetical protein
MPRLTLSGLLLGVVLLVPATGVAQNTPAQAAGGRLTAAEAAAGWISLFDGATLAGWFQSRGDAKWSVTDGALTANPLAQSLTAPPTGFLRTTKAFDNFELKVEFWNEPNTNSGLMIRCDDGCYEVNISDNHAVSPTGSIVGVQSTLPRRIPTVGKWSTFEVTADGTHLVVKVNGETAVDAIDDKHARGAIELQAGGPNGPGVIKFRNIRIRSIPAKK